MVDFIFMFNEESSITSLVSTSGNPLPNPQHPSGNPNNQLSEWEKARIEYLEIIEQPDAKQTLITKVMEGVKEMDTQEELIGNDYIFPKRTPKTPDSSINILYNGETYIFDGTQPITFGHSHWNDIVARNNSNGISRCHFIAIPIYHRSIVIIVDFASLMGTHIHHRTSDKTCPMSTQKKKNLMILDWGEAAEIRVNLSNPQFQQKLLFGPKMCLICLEKARTEAFQCGENNQGHLVACPDCILKLDRCPLCRKRSSTKHLSEDIYSKTLVNLS